MAKTPEASRPVAKAASKREGFSSRKVFLLAAIGSAVGLGNIWRFPYVTYENGGGAFILPYIVALLTAGLPILFFDYAIGHRGRASSPLSFRRLNRGTEFIGWWHVGINAVIAVYYAAIIAWSLRYTIFSFNQAWGDNPKAFFYGEFLHLGTPQLSFDFVPGILIPMAIVWGVLLVVMALGVQKGVGAANIIFMPLLVIMFLGLVIFSLTLPGAMNGVNALFTPDWSALGNGSVWVAAYGQIFFSLSVGFGIMVTYASYLKPKTDLTGSGAVVGFANSGFELLAGIGVFAALGFMAQAAGTSIDQVVTGGIGLAFIAFPTIISQAGAAGALIGVLFFGSLLFAGFTSLISILEVLIACVQDKFALSRVPATIAVTVPLAIVSLLFMPTISGLYVLDILDNFVNIFGILAVALVGIVAVAYLVRALPVLSAHINRYSSIKMGKTWFVLLAIVTPLVLGYNLFISTFGDKGVAVTPYGGYPAEMLNVFGWGMVIALPIIAVIISLMPWSKDSRAAEQPPAPPIHGGKEDHHHLDASVKGN
ncbi:MAG: sodium-dependent transporter [Rothia sp. (in: high G+C Gram-positive bacteria)]|uniref:sodium-dependent transporter n=1 Tax=Rothia sp. (in: high G+C Gram-positive bacteria) TaxID=1885016 RepID=UPI0026DFB7FA|nr:sodium-dependent transporter [Rothia sp. (in: high G+C Gram-positive bacteria)]MDO5751134.1 sodium-dependent transporter [Rothia sp. (in: high G+C Gram-positive bacteria)]